jgi:hypothetical protein
MGKKKDRRGKKERPPKRSACRKVPVDFLAKLKAKWQNKCRIYFAILVAAAGD